MSKSDGIQMTIIKSTDRTVVSLTLTNDSEIDTESEIEALIRYIDTITDKDGAKVN